MEVWPNRSRALMAGLIGAAANVGYMLIAVLGLSLGQAGYTGWRGLMLLGAAPALLTFFIRLFVPESERWLHERERGTTSHWATRDLLAVLAGAGAAIGIVALWTADLPLALQLSGTLAALVVTTLGFIYPILRYLQRYAAGTAVTGGGWETIRLTLLGACLSGVALLGTWASIQWAPVWADQLTRGEWPQARAYTQISSGFGAVVGTVLAAFLGDWLGRRLTYALLCLSSLVSALVFFQLNDTFGVSFLIAVFVAGCCTASFYGWIPLYLPELFRTGVRATAQGFSYNFGRILAAIGVLQTPNLMGLFQGGYPEACSIMSLIYLVGLVIIWFAPETRGKPLPE
jgi:MFS family permease